ncbi:cytochrome b/b6 domain-containing protein [Croceicoccus sp. F390]|uniref:Cytochrome b/b6 domain-containing protein n=1 Tax=Croceicoccus esteveae TaxID=3075597 RepID=A0ABU2ZFX8_9SPHN|nr:cytochrome b/b6 domain-containing protein [Croceicoccus sp. F390]MDT0574983.1 cytochrome b/b6 domain-containing protein [Croceicoccus sp. F390]
MATTSLDSTANAPVTLKRHGLFTRLWHWTNVVAVFTLLMSGLMIFNAHPRLYWGHYGANYDYAWMEIGARGQPAQGYLRVGPMAVQTTGVLGVWQHDGAVRTRAFPHWMTLPSTYSLAEGRRYHFLGAWLLMIAGIAYLGWSMINNHIRRDLLPGRSELRPCNIWQDIRAHARLRLPRGQDAAHYNILQKLSYLLVIFIVLPVMVLTGLGMSPMMNTSWTWVLDLFGGRQSARSVHFITAFILVVFIVVHVAMVFLAGPINELRSMITGRFRLPEERR